jgi:hypothetical protein
MDAAAATAAGLGTDVAPTIVTHIEGEGTLLLRVVPVSDTVVELHAQTGAVYTAETSELERQWHASTQPAIVVTPEPVSVPAAVDPAAVAAPVTPAAAHTNGGSDLGTKLAMGGAVLLPIAGLGAYLATRKRQ